MFDKLLSLLSGDAPPDDLDPTDARLALAALLVRVARADYDYADSEIAVIDQVLAHRYNMPVEKASALRTEAEELEDAAPDTVRFTRAIKNAVPYEDRRSVIQALWKVVLADGARDHEEDGFLRLTANLLGVNDRDSALARQRAQAQLE